jgi:hypothetical protein
MKWVLNQIKEFHYFYFYDNLWNNQLLHQVLWSILSPLIIVSIVLIIISILFCIHAFVFHSPPSNKKLKTTNKNDKKDLEKKNN